MNVPPLSEELQIKACKELGEVPGRVQEDLNNIKEWIMEQPQLNARTDDIWLLNVLRSCKFNLTQTKDTLKLYYTLRTEFPEFFSNRDPLLPEIQKVLNAGILLPIMSGKYDVIFIRWKDTNLDGVTLQNVIKVGFMVCDLCLNESSTCIINGQFIIDDFKGLPLSIISQASPKLLKKLCRLSEAYPARLRELHFINTPYVLRILYNTFRPLLIDELKEKVHCYGTWNMNKITELIPPDLIPKEYGGDGPYVKTITDDLKNKLESNRTWFLDDAQYRLNETKLPSKK